MPPGKWQAYFQPWFELLDCWHRWVQQNRVDALGGSSWLLSRQAFR